MSTDTVVPVQSQDLLDIYEQDTLSGFRMEFIQVYNWGTFHQTVGTAILDGQTTLLTGENGAGKSTLADAIVTLLVPTNYRNYNAASGEGKRERSEPDYIRGNVGTTYDDLRERDVPQYLREDGKFYSVLLACFRNKRENKAVTLAQVLWIKSNGDTGKRFIVESRKMTIEGDLAGFTSTANIQEELKQRGLDAFDQFKPYSEKFHRLLKLDPARNPMGIFNQTVAVKDIRNLTHFIREYMLESGSAREYFEKLKERVRELRETYNLIKMQKEQLVLLESIAAYVSVVLSTREAKAVLDSQRTALDSFFQRTELRLRLRDSEQNGATIADLTQTRTRWENEKEIWGARVEALRQQQKSSSHGAELAALEQEIATLTRAVNVLKETDQRFQRDVAVLFPNRRCETAETVTALLAQLPRELAALEADREALAEKERTLRDQVRDLLTEYQRLEREITSLMRQHTLIDEHILARRDAIADALNIPRNKLPFVGELLQVAKAHKRWTGAIERLVRGYALTILVPEEYKERVDTFVNTHNMRGRVEYEIVAPNLPPPATKPDANTVAARIEIKPDSGDFGRYIQRDLYRRFSHQCCETTDVVWHSVHEALTVDGLFKGRSGRRIKDDDYDVRDETRWILGWDNQAKIMLLKEQQGRLQKDGEKAQVEHCGAEAAVRTHGQRLQAAQNLTNGKFTFESIDYRSTATLIERKKSTQATLRKDPSLEKLSAEIDNAAGELATAEKNYRDADFNLRTKEQAELDNLARIEALKPLTAAASPADENTFILIKRRLDLPPQTVAELANRQRALYGELTKEIDGLRGIEEEKTRLALAKMQEVIRHDGWQHLHDELHPTPPENLTPEVIERFKRVENRIRKDDIPKNEEKYKRLLHETAVDDYNTFYQSLETIKEAIRTRISEINGHLQKVDFDRRQGQETYITLQPENTKDATIKTYRDKLNKARQGSLNIDVDEDARENCFHVVNALIEELDKDPKVRDTVIDVRNWFEFKAEERFRATGQIKETYQSAQKKSGGEKSRLTSTILATAIAYQYDIKIDRPDADTFRFVLIDEALSRIGDEFSEYLFEVFARFHLQLLIIHPRDSKLHITEKYVRRYNVALKPKLYSTVKNISVHEFHELKNRFADS